MNRIFKYALNRTGITELLLPMYASIYSVQLQDGAPVFWATVNPEASAKVVRRFAAVMTGASPPTSNIYLATLQFPNGIVMHCFEVP